jgi:hypothetical protein
MIKHDEINVILIGIIFASSLKDGTGNTNCDARRFKFKR